MSTITNLQFWQDPGYTDGCIEVPRIGASLPSPGYEHAAPVNPSKDRMFSELRLPVDFETLYDMCYLRAVYEMNNGRDLTVYGWVDSVECQSDTSGYPVTVIQWHIDQWRTFIGSAEFGSGMVTRRPVSGAMPPQDYPYRYLQCSSGDFIALCPNSGIWWVILNYQYVSDQYTYSQWAAFPVNIHDPYRVGYIRGSDGSESAVCMGVGHVLAGLIDELLAIDPESITYVGLSPIGPKSVTGSGTQGDPWVADLDMRQPGEGSYFVFTFAVNDIDYTSWLAIDAQTTDTDQYVVLDFDSNPILTLPWGIAVTRYRARLVPSIAGASIALCFDTGDSSLPRSSVLGLIAYISCPSLDVNANAWSSYVYSGAREVASRQLQLSAQANLVSGLTGAGTSAIGGGVMGGMTAGPIGAAVGAGAGAVTAIVGSAVNYAYQSGAYADQMMDINDYEASHQTSTILLSGSGGSFLSNGQIWPVLIHITKDDYSLEQRANDLEIYGCTVSEPTASCQSLINSGGPLRIQNLVVGGDIPAQAKQYIRQRFAGGVRMI